MDSHTAVKIFFIISGFYMALILSQKYGSVSGGLRAFAINRFLRLYPLYAVVLVFTIGWYLARLALLGDRAPTSGIFEMRSYLNGWQMLGVWLSNISLIGLDFVCSWHWSPDSGFLFLHSSGHETQSSNVFLGSAVWVIQAWSISMEILFYLCAPLLARLRTCTLAGVIIASIGVDYWLSSSLGRTTYFFAPAQLYLFATGMMLYRAYNSLDLANLASQQRSLMVRLVGVSFLIAWCLPALLHQPPQWLLLLGFAVLYSRPFCHLEGLCMGQVSRQPLLPHLLVTHAGWWSPWCHLETPQCDWKLGHPDCGLRLHPGRDDPPPCCRDSSGCYSQRHLQAAAALLITHRLTLFHAVRDIHTLSNQIKRLF